MDHNPLSIFFCILTAYFLLPLIVERLAMALSKKIHEENLQHICVKECSKLGLDPNIITVHFIFITPLLELAKLEYYNEKRIEIGLYDKFLSHSTVCLRKELYRAKIILDSFQNGKEHKRSQLNSTGNDIKCGLYAIFGLKIRL